MQHLGHVTEANQSHLEAPITSRALESWGLLEGSQPEIFLISFAILGKFPVFGRNEWAANVCNFLWLYRKHFRRVGRSFRSCRLNWINTDLTWYSSLEFEELVPALYKDRAISRQQYNTNLPNVHIIRYFQFRGKPSPKILSRDPTGRSPSGSGYTAASTSSRNTFYPCGRTTSSRFNFTFYFMNVLFIEHTS